MHSQMRSAALEGTDIGFAQMVERLVHMEGSRVPEPIYPIILSGGSGTRLWPLSRASYPKQFISFDGAEASFLQATALRLHDKPGFESPTVICSSEHRFLVGDQLEACGVAPRDIVLEPVPRGTAPAVAISALRLADHSDAVIVIMPSDHVIQNVGLFIERLQAATAVARSGKLVTFGIRPTDPNTGYGYIRRGEALASNGADAFAIAHFVEKPDLPTAKRLCADGEHYWNSGMFVLHVGTLIEELERLQPAIMSACREALTGAQCDLRFLRLDPQAFAGNPSISIDHAIMEKTECGAVVPLDAGWLDIGSWASLWQLGCKDSNRNSVSGASVLEDVSDCLIHSERSLVAALGVDNLVIVDTPDALLVAKKDRAQEVNRLVERLKRENRPVSSKHIFSHRPWGRFETLSEGDRFHVKRLTVKPGGKLSLQMHLHRSEHWVVVRGTARVTRGDEECYLQENESTYISPTQWHRLENPGKTMLEIIEVQLGTYLQEDDIIRTEDVYLRQANETS